MVQLSALVVPVKSLLLAILSGSSSVARVAERMDDINHNASSAPGSLPMRFVHGVVDTRYADLLQQGLVPSHRSTTVPWSDEHVCGGGLGSAVEGSRGKDALARNLAAYAREVCDIADAEIPVSTYALWMGNFVEAAVALQTGRPEFAAALLQHMVTAEGCFCSNVPSELGGLQHLLSKYCGRGLRGGQ
eukprot:m.789630 g.789630  ORF g.789630 m.789630 type:complete len:189 (-) comp23324_c0_seq4:1876-2442(-)